MSYDPNRTYLQREYPGTFTKPVGFWVSVKGEGDWIDYLDTVDYHDDVHYEHSVSLTKDADILYLNDYQDMVAFQEIFGVVKDTHYGYQDLRIDWLLVTQHYAGIIIPTFDGQARRDLDWYFNWDCASGCIWDLSAISSVKPSGMKAINDYTRVA